MPATGGRYAGSQEELTPLGWDWPSVIPAIFAGLWLLANPAAAHTMAKRAWGSHLLSVASIRVIRDRIPAVTEENR